MCKVCILIDQDVPGRVVSTWQSKALPVPQTTELLMLRVKVGSSIKAFDPPGLLLLSQLNVIPHLAPLTPAFEEVKE